MEAIKPYYQQARDEMLAYIPPNITRTLEIGCGAGSFSEQLKNDLGVETWGVEYQADVAELAAQKLHCLLVGSFEKKTWLTSAVCFRHFATRATYASTENLYSWSIEPS